MGGHALRGMVTAWLALIVLQTVSTDAGSGRVAGLFADVNRLVKRALDPSVPAIPDRRSGASSGGYWTPSGGPFTPTAPGPIRPGTHPGAQYDPQSGAAVGFGF